MENFAQTSLHLAIGQVCHVVFCRHIVKFTVLLSSEVEWIHLDITSAVSLTPGFSTVLNCIGCKNGFRVRVSIHDVIVQLSTPPQTHDTQFRSCCKQEKERSFPIFCVFMKVSDVPGAGLRVQEGKVHFCILCEYPVAVYGRVWPCLHSYCLSCASSLPSCSL